MRYEVYLLRGVPNTNFYEKLLDVVHLVPAITTWVITHLKRRSIMLGESLIVLMSLLHKLIKIFQEELHWIAIIFFSFLWKQTAEESYTKIRDFLKMHKVTTWVS